jgi:hypothetical protein
VLKKQTKRISYNATKHTKSLSDYSSDPVFFGKCKECNRITEVDVDAGLCSICAKLLAEEQEKQNI